MKTKSPEGFKEPSKYKLIRPLHNPKAGLRGFIAIHRKHKNYPSLGATRFWHYRSEAEALKDATNLARLMTYKSAISGLPYGGAKGVIMAPTKCSRAEKNKILAAYAEELNKLGGDFITGSDVGLDMDDVRFLKKKTRFVIGTRFNPEYYTALGVYFSLKTALKNIFGTDNFSQRNFALAGLGKTGMNVLKFISKEKPRRILISDLNKKNVARAKKILPGAKYVSPDKILFQAADVLMPCALGGVLTPKTAKRVKAKLILGSANNQLENSQAGRILKRRGILYAPDYIVNAGGLISVAEELSRHPSKKTIVKKVVKIKDTLKKVIKISKKTGKPTSVVADELAEKIFKKH